MEDKLNLKDYNRRMIISIALSVAGIALIFSSQYLSGSLLMLAAGLIVCIYAFIYSQMNIRRYRSAIRLKSEEVKKKNEETYNRILNSRKQ